MTDQKKLKKNVSVELLIFLGFLMISLIGVAGIEILRLDVRFALMAQDMETSGLQVFPTVNGVPYADYPSPFLILSYLTTGYTRFLDLGTLVLPTLFFGAFTVAATWKLGEKLRTGLGSYAVLFLCGTYEFDQLFTGVGMDIPVMAAGVAMLNLLASPRKPARDLALFALLLSACFFIRGPLGLLLLGGGVAGYLLGARRFRELPGFGLVGGGVAVFCAWAGYQLILRQGGRELWQVFLDWQIYSRVNQAPNHSIFYFFTNAIASFAPVTLLAVLTLWFKWRKLKSEPVWGGLFGFILTVLLMLSVPTCKHLRYMIITLPVFALFAGWGCVSVHEELRLLWLRRAGRVLFVGGGVIWIVLGVIAGILLPGEAPGMHFLLSLLLGAELFCVWRKWKGEREQTLFLAALMLTLFNVLIFPFTAGFNGSASFVERVESLRGESKVYLYHLGPDHQDNQYVLNMEKNRRQEAVRLYARESLENMPAHSRMMYSGKTIDSVVHELASGGVVVMMTRRYDEFKADAERLGLKHRILCDGTLAHKDAIALTVAEQEPLIEEK